MPRLSRQLPKSSVWWDTATSWEFMKFSFLERFHVISDTVYLVLICKHIRECKPDRSAHSTRIAFAFGCRKGMHRLHHRTTKQAYIMYICVYNTYFKILSSCILGGLWSRDALPSSFKIHSLPHQSTKGDPQPWVSHWEFEGVRFWESPRSAMAFSTSAVSQNDLFLKIEIVLRCFVKSMIFIMSTQKVLKYNDLPCKTWFHKLQLLGSTKPQAWGSFTRPW